MEYTFDLYQFKAILLLLSVLILILMEYTFDPMYEKRETESKKGLNPYFNGIYF